MGQDIVLGILFVIHIAIRANVLNGSVRDLGRVEALGQLIVELFLGVAHVLKEVHAAEAGTFGEEFLHDLLIGGLGEGGVQLNVVAAKIAFCISPPRCVCCASSRRFTPPTT